MNSPRLSYREKVIVKLRDGDEFGNKYSQAECARILKVTVGRIRSIEAKARAKLKATTGG